jgi:hypothetical protein
MTTLSTLAQDATSRRRLIALGVRAATTVRRLCGAAALVLAGCSAAGSVVSADGAGHGLSAVMTSERFELIERNFAQEFPGAARPPRSAIAAPAGAPAAPPADLATTGPAPDAAGEVAAHDVPRPDRVEAPSEPATSPPTARPAPSALRMDEASRSPLAPRPASVSSPLAEAHAVAPSPRSERADDGARPAPAVPHVATAVAPAAAPPPLPPPPPPVPATLSGSPAAPAPPAARAPEPPRLPRVSLKADGIPLQTVLRMLARSAGLKLELGRGVKPTDIVSADVTDEPVDQAIRSLVEEYGWEVELEGDRLRVTAEITRSVRLNFPHLSRSYSSGMGGGNGGTSGTTGTVGSGLGGVTIPASTTATTLSGSTMMNGTTGLTTATTGAGTPYGGAGGASGNSSVSYKTTSEGGWGAIEDVAKKILGDHGTMVVHHDTGVVWLRGRADVVNEAVRKLQTIDVELSRQVALEVSVIDVVLSDRTRYGIDWTKVFTIGQWGSITLLGPSAIGGGLAGSGFTAKVARRGSPDSLILRALSEQGNARVLSQPKLLVMNGQTAMLTVGDVIPYVSSVQQSVVGGVSSTVVATPTISQVQTGLSIAISARVQEDQVLLHITPVLNEVTEFKTFTVGDNSFENPVVSTKSLTTLARALSGETVLLGGLIDSKNRLSRDGLPVLSKMPVIGALFRSEDHNVANRELVILITPTIRPPLGVASGLPAQP